MRTRRRSSATHLVLVVLTAAGVAAVTVAPAAGQAAPRRTAGAQPAPQADPAAVLALARAVDAERTTAYAGTQVLSHWGPSGTTSGVMTVAHRPGEGTVMGMAATVSSGDATAGRVLLTSGAAPRATGDSGRAAAAADGAAMVGGTEDASASLELLRRHYEVRSAGSDSALGRTAAVVEARRPGVAGVGAVAARFWVDQDTGLLLRRESYDTDGALTRSVSFVDLRLGVAVGPPTEPGPLTRRVPSVGEAMGTRIDAAGLAGVAAEGFWVGAELPGGLERHDARARSDEGGRVVHLAFSDGLSSLSVFQQHGRLVGVPEGWRVAQVAGHDVVVHDEPPQRVAWQSGDVVVTVVGDLGPRGTAEVVAALPHTPADGDGGVRARWTRGVDRLADWVGR